MNAFEKDTLYRLLVESTRFWVIANWLENHELPKQTTFYTYPGGPLGFDWGNAPGPDDEAIERPLRGKRVRITLEIEDHK